MSRSGWALMRGDAPFSPRGPVFILDTMWAGAGGRRTRSCLRTWTFEHDEGIGADTTLERLAALPLQQGMELMTAGNWSQLSDGASAIVVAGEEWARKQGARPLARVLAAAPVGVDPTIRGIAPAYAMPRALELVEREARYGCLGIWVGSGQGVAFVIERVQ